MVIIEFHLNFSIQGTTSYFLDTLATGYGSVIKREYNGSGAETTTVLTGLTQTGLTTVKQVANANGHFPVAFYANCPVDSSGADSTGRLTITCDLTFIPNSF
jgi:hypothetical protein